jgi:hypothetical protein
MAKDEDAIKRREEILGQRVTFYAATALMGVDR